MNKSVWHLLLRISVLLIGSLVCASVLWGASARIPWAEVLGFGLLASLLRLRAVVLIRDRDGMPLFTHVPGESVLLVAVLRHGPETAVAVGLLTNCIAAARLWPEWPQAERRLSFLTNAIFLSAAAGVFGFLYQNQGGASVQTLADCDRVFQQPFAVQVPLLVASFVIYEVLYRLYYSISLHLGHDLSLRRVLFDPTLGLFRHIENVGALIGLVLWTRWGWGTLPFTALMMEAMLLSAREFFRRLELRGEVVTDPLTGLANARGIQDAIQTRLRAGHAFTLLFLDIDNFKQVNDRFGHAAGDELLCRIAQTLQRAVRTDDVIGRQGGDEFVVVLAEVGTAESERVVGRLRKTLDRLVAEHAPARSVGLGLSIGLAVYPADGISEAQLMDAADRRMYLEKRARKQSVAEPLAASA